MLIINDKKFELFIPSATIINVVKQMADEINREYINKQVHFVGVMNGAFMFVSDLLKFIKVSCEVHFIKLASYNGDASTGKIKEVFGLNTALTNKTVIVLEDIVDTGRTLDHICRSINTFNPAELKVVSLLYKPDASQTGVKPDMAGIEIANDFVVGYGLDYQGLGRNLPDIYRVIDDG
ncbi:MAG: hypoxanthine phosphoribosyltransferase [Bacteroidales bacterium]|nr:hypoxanthine phosphoribosyltransferase [Bacteroidales bacterium]